MALPKHVVDWLQSGQVTAWNAWRDANPHVTPNLRGLNLRGLNLAGINLTGTNLGDVDLREADLSHADLSGEALLLGTWLCNADLTGANLADAIFGNTDLTGVKGLSDDYIRRAVDHGLVTVSR